MNITKTKQVFTAIEQAFEADIEESSLNRQKFAALMWRDREHTAAYHVLQRKLTINRKPDLTIQEVINGLIELGTSENTVRYFCDQLGYNMPTRKSEDETSTAEEEIKKIDADVEILHDELFKKLSQKREFQRKINRVPQCKNDFPMTETN